MSKIKERIFKFKLCTRIEKGESFKDICNELVDQKYYPEKFRYLGNNDKYTTLNILYNFYYNYKKWGILSILDLRENKGFKNNMQRTMGINNKRQFLINKLINTIGKNEVSKLTELQLKSLKFKGLSKSEIYEQVKKEYEKTKHFSIKNICLLLGISKSYYYLLRSQEKKNIDKRVRTDKNDIKKYILQIYNKSKGTYGARRIKNVLKTPNYGINISYKTIFKYMKELDLKSKIRAKNKRRVDWKNTNVDTPNLLNRNFKNDSTNKTICTDVTYIKWRGSFVYLSAAILLSNNEIVGWSVSKRNDNELVKRSFDNIDLSKIKIIHSDHGYQYTSKFFKELIDKNNITQSMSRVGNSLDNRPIEYWFSILKSECIWLQDIDSLEYEQLIKLISDFIWYYNNERIQLNLKNLTPLQYGKLD